MLKIKDNVDLKELEKYGFSTRYNEFSGNPIEIYYYDNNGYIEELIKVDEDKEIHIARLSVQKRYDILYDLIKDGLVEKVED